MRLKSLAIRNDSVNLKLLKMMTRATIATVLIASANAICYEQCNTNVFNPRTCECLDEYPMCTMDMCDNGNSRDNYDCGCYDEPA